MLTSRMQRTGRKGHAMFRVVVQDARVTPTSGKVVAMLGSYDPHAKATTLDKEKAATFLKNGAQPSDRVALLLKSEGVKLPKWVSVDTKKSGKPKNPDKFAKDQPKVAEAEEAPATETTPEEPTVEAVAGEPVVDAPTAEATVEEAPVEEAASEVATEEPAEVVPEAGTESAAKDKA